MDFNPSTAATLVPKVLSVRFHATTRGNGNGSGGSEPRDDSRAAEPPPPAKRARTSFSPLPSPSLLPSPWTGSVAAAAGAAAASAAVAAAHAPLAQLTPPPPPHLAIYRTFATQAAAFEFWDACGAHAPKLRTFAVEHDASGRRAFIVAAPERFWAEYRALPHAQRNHYEIIREGCPCHLYFDLEFVPALNPRADGNALVRALVDDVALTLRDLYDAPLTPAMVLELDSSTPEKWSRHLIVRVPGAAFAHNGHAGAFVRAVVLRALARSARSSGAGGASLVVAGKHGGAALAVDMGVYTRNRAFRLHLSSKAGRGAHLRATPRFGGATRDPREFFFDALVAATPFGPLRQQDDQQQQEQQQQQQQGEGQPEGGLAFGQHHHHHQQQQQQAGFAAPAAPPAHRKVVWLPAWRFEQAAVAGGGGGGPAAAPPPGPPGAARRGVSLLRCEDVPWDALLAEVPPEWRHLATPHRYDATAVAGGAAHHQHQQQQHFAHGALPAAALWRDARDAAPAPSPFPDVDAFIAAACARAGGAPGAVRSWVHSAAAGALLLNVRANRWCGNVGREHRSNGVYYIVDLAGGTWHQRCYDPECRGYRSECMPLPLDLWARHRDAAAAAVAAAGVRLHPHPQQQQQQHYQHHYQQQQAAGGSGIDENDDALLRVMDEFEASRLAGASCVPGHSGQQQQQQQQHCSSGALRPTQPRAGSCALQAGCWAAAAGGSAGGVGSSGGFASGGGGCWMDVDDAGRCNGAADDAALLEP